MAEESYHPLYKMKRKILSVLVVLGIIASLGMSFTPVRAECPTNAIVRVLPGFSLSIRSGAGKEFALLGSLNFDSGEQKSIEIKNDYRKLDGQINGQDRWIWDHYLTVVCEFTPTPTFTPTKIPTNTPEPTPTRVTAIPNTIYVWINNTAFICTNPCDLHIEIK